MFSFVALEAYAKGVFQRVPKRCQSRKVDALDLQAGIMGVRGQNCGHVAGLRQRGVVEQNTAQKLDHALAQL